MNENEVAKIIVDVAYHLHKRLGPGIFESVYEVIFDYELRKRGLTVKRQVPVPVVWDNIAFDEGFRADLIVNDLVVVELKPVEKLAPVHSKQVLTYLRLTKMKLGLLINFGEELIRDGINRIVNGLPDEHS